MKGAYYQYIALKGEKPTSNLSPAVEEAAALRKEAATLRLARIQNGKEPGYCKGGRCASK